MTTLTRLLFTHPLKNTAQAKQIFSSKRRKTYLNLQKEFVKADSGLDKLNVTANVGVAAATATITFSTHATAADTIVIGNVTFTAESSGATGNQFNIGSTATDSATNLAAAINASTNMAGIVTASPAAGVVTLTAVVPGTIGNGLALSKSSTAATLAAFSSGSDGTAFSYVN